MIKRITPGKCALCGQPISWFLTEKGKYMPCELEPVAYGKRLGKYMFMDADTGKAIMRTYARKKEYGRGYVPHNTRCEGQKLLAEKFGKGDVRRMPMDWKLKELEKIRKETRESFKSKETQPE